MQANLALEFTEICRNQISYNTLDHTLYYKRLVRQWILWSCSSFGVVAASSELVFQWKWRYRELQVHFLQLQTPSFL